MDVTNCKSCGRLFNVITNSRICPDCLNKLEEKFQEVKQYLRENPNATMEVLGQECDVTVKQIKQWVREERLAFTEGSADGITCEQCGAAILTGRFCDMCKTKLTNNLKSATYVEKREPDKKGHERDRMRFLQGL